MESISPEARGRSNSGDPNATKAWSGVVVSNPVVRVTTNFMLRFKNRRQKVKVFSTEAEAIRFVGSNDARAAPERPARSSSRR